MNLLRSSCIVALAIIAGASACVGSEPEVVSPGPGGDDAGSGVDTGTNPADASGDAGDSGTCGQQTSCGGSCVDTTSSSDHCGVCGHSCGGGKCKDSVCAPVLVASNIAAPLGVAVAGGSAFWIRNGAVERCPVTGCTGAPTLITVEVVMGAGQPGGTTLVSDGNQVAWIANGNASGNGRDVFQCGVAGCLNGFPPKASTGLTDAPTQIAVEGSTLFASQLTGAARQGPMSTLVMTGTGLGSDVPTGIAADATNIYIAGVAQSAAGVDRCTRAGVGMPCTATTRLFVGAVYIAAGGGLVLATSTEGIKKCAATGCGGSAAVVMASDTAAAAIAASSTFGAWVNSGSTTTGDGTVRACTLPACAAPRTVAAGQDQQAGGAIADGFVYGAKRGVGVGTGSIWRAAL
ncbi:hypothetical protein BH11MYX4_BH11MYX4_57660 [soil metagenome]